MNNNLYEDLGLKQDPPPSVDEIRTAYRKLARQFRPDVSTDQNSEDNSENFRRVEFAYSILSDSGKRGIYDATGCVQGKKEDELLLKALTLIQRATYQVYAYRDPESNLLAEICIIISIELAELTRTKTELVAKIDSSEKILTGLKIHFKGNLIVLKSILAVYGKEVADLTNCIKSNEQEILIREKARKLLSECTYNSPTQPFMYTITISDPLYKKMETTVNKQIQKIQYTSLNLSKIGRSQSSIFSE